MASRELTEGRNEKIRVKVPPNNCSERDLNSHRNRISANENSYAEQKPNLHASSTKLLTRPISEGKLGIHTQNLGAISSRNLNISLQKAT
jgi:hypothetical protein